MTLVMAWHEPPDGGIWLVSDSRVSNEGLSGGRVISSDHAAKVLSISVRVVRQEMGEPWPRTIAETSFGMAYAGSTLIALQAFAAANLLWSHLQVSGDTPFPSAGVRASLRVTVAMLQVPPVRPSRATASYLGRSAQARCRWRSASSSKRLAAGYGPFANR